MTAKEIKRLERIATQVLAGYSAHPSMGNNSVAACATFAIEQAQELIKQLDALKIPE